MTDTTEDRIGPDRPPDPVTLRWMAAMILKMVEKVEIRSSLVASGTDRVAAKASISALSQVAELCLNTADAVEEEQRRREDQESGERQEEEERELARQMDLPEGVVS